MSRCKVILSISFYTLFTAPVYPQVPITAPFLLSYWSTDQYYNNTLFMFMYMFNFPTGAWSYLNIPLLLVYALM